MLPRPKGGSDGPQDSKENQGGKTDEKDVTHARFHAMSLIPSCGYPQNIPKLTYGFESLLSNARQGL
jgi:hypothetical protein